MRKSQSLPPRAARLSRAGVMVAGGGHADTYPLPHVLNAPAPSCKTLLTFSLTEEQRSHLSFAVTCQLDALIEGHEVDEPEVQAALECLSDAQRILDAPEQGRPL